MMGSARDGFRSVAQGTVVVCFALLLARAACPLYAAEDVTSATGDSPATMEAAAPPITALPAPVASGIAPAPEGARLIFGEYLIQPGDRLHMSVWGEPSLTTDTMVMTEGQVAFPLLGELSATDKTMAGLTEDVRQGYLRYYRDPRVTLLVTPAVWPSVYVQGNVGEPGPVDYSPGRTVLDYVGMAGGFRADADLSKIGIVSRRGGDTASTTVDMSAIAFASERVSNPMLKPGDTIWVGRALPISVLGAVNRPGAVDYRPGLRLSDYVGMAGGPTNRAVMGSVSVKHTDAKGENSVAQFDLSAALAQPEDSALNPVLAPGDTVTVPERFIAGTLEWSEILRAVAGIIIWQ